jgi:hypothetical protein
MFVLIYIPCARCSMLHRVSPVLFDAQQIIKTDFRYRYFR